MTPDTLRTLASIQELAAERVRAPTTPRMTSLESADLEDAISNWFDAHNIADSWDYATTFADAGLGVEWLREVQSSLAARGGLASTPR